MDERRGLKRVSGTLATHVAPGKTPQLGVDQRDEAIEGGAITGAPRLEQRRHLRCRWGLHDHSTCQQLVLASRCL